MHLTRFRACFINIYDQLPSCVCTKFGLDFCFCDSGVKFDFNFYWVLAILV